MFSHFYGRSPEGIGRHKVKMSSCLSICHVTFSRPLIGQKRECYIVEEVIDVDELDKVDICCSSKKGKAELSYASLGFYFAYIHGFTRLPAWIPCFIQFKKEISIKVGGLVRKNIGWEIENSIFFATRMLHHAGGGGIQKTCWCNSLTFPYKNRSFSSVLDWLNFY